MLPEQLRHTFIGIRSTYLYNGETDPSMGLFGVEGSKPGTAVVATSFSYKIIGLHKTGYGQLLGQAHFSTKMLYCMFATMANEEDPFVIFRLQSLSVDELTYAKHLLGVTNEEIEKDEKVKEFLSKKGPDLNINGFVVSFKEPSTGQLNTCLDKLNKLALAVGEDMNITYTTDATNSGSNGSTFASVRVSRKRLFLIRSTLAYLHADLKRKLLNQLGIKEDGDLFL